jgi:hypothetical protein
VVTVAKLLICFASGLLRSDAKCGLASVERLAPQFAAVELDQFGSLSLGAYPALYDGPRIAKVRIPDFDTTLRGPHRGRDVAGLHPFNGQDVAVEVEGACSTGCPAWTHASIPPRSGRIFLNPACFRCLAATAADSSFGHAQYTTISSSRE